jgi:hypothetical protein
VRFFSTQDVLGAKLVAPGMQEPMLTAERMVLGVLRKHGAGILNCSRVAGEKRENVSMIVGTCSFVPVSPADHARNP